MNNVPGRGWVVLGVAAVLSVLLAGCQSAPLRLQKSGLAAYDAGHYQTALDDFNHALNYNVFDAKNNYYAGNAALKLGRLETAAYHYKLAWQANPGLPEVKDALTETYLRLGKPDEALDFLERDAALTAKTQDPRALKAVQKRRYVYQPEELMYLNKARDRVRIAQTYEKLGDLDNARVYFDQAVQMAPKQPEVLIAAASFYARIKQPDKARALFQKVYEIDPTAPGLADAMQQAGMTVTWK